MSVPTCERCCASIDESPCSICCAPKGVPCDLRVHFPKGQWVMRGDGMVLEPWPDQ